MDDYLSGMFGGLGSSLRSLGMFNPISFQYGGAQDWGDPYAAARNLYGNQGMYSPQFQTPQPYGLGQYGNLDWMDPTAGMQSDMYNDAFNSSYDPYDYSSMMSSMVGYQPGTLGRMMPQDPGGWEINIENNLGAQGAESELNGTPIPSGQSSLTSGDLGTPIPSGEASMTTGNLPGPTGIGSSLTSPAGGGSSLSTLPGGGTSWLTSPPGGIAGVPVGTGGPSGPPGPWGTIPSGGGGGVNTELRPGDLGGGPSGIAGGIAGGGAAGGALGGGGDVGTFDDWLGGGLGGAVSGGAAGGDPPFPPAFVPPDGPGSWWETGPAGEGQNNHWEKPGPNGIASGASGSTPGDGGLPYPPAMIPPGDGVGPSGIASGSSGDELPFPPAFQPPGDGGPSGIATGGGSGLLNPPAPKPLAEPGGFNPLGTGLGLMESLNDPGVAGTKPLPQPPSGGGLGSFMDSLGGAVSGGASGASAAPILDNGGMNMPNGLSPVQRGMNNMSRGPLGGGGNSQFSQYNTKPMAGTSGRPTQGQRRGPLGGGGGQGGGGPTMRGPLGGDGGESGGGGGSLGSMMPPMGGGSIQGGGVGGQGFGNAWYGPQRNPYGGGGGMPQMGPFGGGMPYQQPQMQSPMNWSNPFGGGMMPFQGANYGQQYSPGRSNSMQGGGMNFGNQMVPQQPRQMYQGQGPRMQQMPQQQMLSSFMPQQQAYGGGIQRGGRQNQMGGGMMLPFGMASGNQGGWQGQGPFGIASRWG